MLKSRSVQCLDFGLRVLGCRVRSFTFPGFGVRGVWDCVFLPRKELCFLQSSRGSGTSED